MDEKIGEVLEILADYDSNISRTLNLYEYLEEDDKCDNDTLALAEGLLIAVMLDKAAAFIPDGEEEQRKVMSQAEGLPEVMGTLPDPIPLIYQVSIGYAVALSQGRNGWRPWERVREKILWPEGEDDPETTH